MPQTPNLKIILFNASDGAVTFEEYWHSININGDGTNIDLSAFQIIDTEFGKTYTNIAPLFSNASTYNVGDLVVYSGVLYECIEDILFAGDWDSTKWSATSVSNILGQLNTALVNLNSGSGV